MLDFTFCTSSDLFRHPSAFLLIFLFLLPVFLPVLQGRHPVSLLECAPKRRRVMIPAGMCDSLHGQLRRRQKPRRPCKPVTGQIFLRRTSHIFPEQRIQITSIDTHIFCNIRYPYGMSVVVLNIAQRLLDIQIVRSMPLYRSWLL